jgi:magnesium transporter
MTPNSQHGRHQLAPHLAIRPATASANETVAAVLAHLAATTSDFVEVVHVLDAQGRLRGAVPMQALLTAPPDQSMTALAHPAQPVSADTTPERIASHALRHGLTAVPLVDHGSKLLGVVTPRGLMEILRREHVEDLHRMTGIRREAAHGSAQARAAIEAPPLRRARDRLPWLLAGLLGAMLATYVVAAFEDVLTARVTIAFFVPAIVYLADAIGTQTEAIAVRGLSLSHAPMRRLVWGELRTGLTIGIVLGGIAWAAIWFVFADSRLATAVALALVVAGTAASTIGLLLPWLLAALGRDPAFGSGPLATIIQDVLSLAIYFAIASVLLL